MLSLLLVLAILAAAGTAVYFFWWDTEEPPLPVGPTSSSEPAPKPHRSHRGGVEEHTYSAPSASPPQPGPQASPPPAQAPAPSAPVPAPSALAPATPTPGTACVQIYGQQICQPYQRPRGGSGGNGLSPANPNYYTPNRDYGPGIYR